MTAPQLSPATTGGAHLVAGIDVGGTKTLAVALDATGVERARRRIPTGKGPTALLASTVEVFERLAGDLGLPTTGFAAVGIGVPGIVDVGAGTTRRAVNLEVGDAPVAIGARLSTVSGGPVVVENDVNAAAWGAAEVLPWGRDLAYLSVGTGVAAGVVLDGRLRRGRHALAGEIGHLPLDPSGPVCGCGQRGCLESLTSGAALVRRWRDADGRSTAGALVAAATSGDELAVVVLREMGDHLATAFTVLALAVDPGALILGGGVAEAGAPLLVAVLAALRRQAGHTPLLHELRLADRVRLVPADCPVGAIGAAHLARRLVGR